MRPLLASDVKTSAAAQVVAAAIVAPISAAQHRPDALMVLVLANADEPTSMPLLRSGQDAAALSGSAPAVSMVGGTTQRAADTTVPVVTSSLYLQLADVDGVSVYNFPALDAHFRVQEEHKHTLVRLHGVERTASAIRGVQVVDCLPVDGACVSSFGRSASQSASAHFPGLKDNDTQCTARFLSPRRASMTRLFMQVSVRVCLKFVPHPSPGHVVHHKNSRPEDNHACNLATGTQSENMLERMCMPWERTCTSVEGRPVEEGAMWVKCTSNESPRTRWCVGWRRERQSTTPVAAEMPTTRSSSSCVSNGGAPCKVIWRVRASLKSLSTAS